MGKLDLSIDKSTLQDIGDIMVIIFSFEKDFIFDKVYIF